MLRPTDQIPNASQPVLDAQKKREELVTKMTSLRSELSQLKKDLKEGRVVDPQAHQQRRLPLLAELADLEKEVATLSDFILSGGVPAKPGNLVPLVADARLRKNLGKIKFVEPKSISEATQRMDALSQEVRRIELQFTSRSVIGQDGKPSFRPEDSEWRSKARFAKGKMEAEVSTLKRWIRDRQTLIDGPVDIEGVDTTDPKQLLWALYRLLGKRLKVEWDALEPDEQLVMRAVRDYIQKNA